MRLFGLGSRPQKSALDELKERLTLPPLKQAEEEVMEFYGGRNPYAHVKEKWPPHYENFIRGFASALQRCRKEGIVDHRRLEAIASTTALGMARAGFRNREAA